MGTEAILDRIGIPSAAALDMYYKQITRRNDLPITGVTSSGNDDEKVDLDDVINELELWGAL